MNTTVPHFSLAAFPATPAASNRGTSPEATRASARRRGTPHPEVGTILLVDDDLTVLESLRRVLVSEGLRVIAARNGEEAIEILGRIKPDLVITDLCMGAVSGWDLVFHYHLHRAGLPFFVITALPLKDAGGVEQIAAAFFQKPLDLEDMLTAIHTHLEAVQPKR